MIEGLSMDGVKAGDASIEEQLNEIREAKIQNLHSTYGEQECEYHSDEYYTPNSETEYMTVPYVSEDYIGVLMDGLVFYYTVYEVASYAMGMPSVQIPYDELSWKLPLYG